MSPLFVPGPVDVEADVLAAQTQPMLPHRSVEFEAIFQRVLKNALQIFNTQSRVFIFTSSGTGLQEAAIRNLSKENVLSCVNGAFSQRWHDVARMNGKQADLLEVEWGLPITPQLVSEALQHKTYEAITIVHNETSTGVQNPVKEISAVVHAQSPQTLICVDAVSSLGGTVILMDDWGLDMVLASSQKCLALPPGLALAAVSDRAVDYAYQVPDRGWYFDLVRMEEHRTKDSTPATPALSLIYAMDMQLGRILNEGLDERCSRHSIMARRVQDWVLANGFELFAPEGYRSQTVTTVSNTHNIDLSDLDRYLASKDMRIAGGYGRLKGKTFRIAHMGQTQLSDIDRLLSTLDEYLSQYEAIQP
jgi:aspartate aminotransferase-like enzyme